jgi:hypothetical protein
MGRIMLAVAAGAALGLMIAAFIGWAAVYAFPPSVLVDMDPSKALTTPMPMAEIVVQILGWIIATLAAGFVAVRTAEQGDWPAWATGAVMAVGVILFALFRPHPMWFVILCAAVVAATGFGAGWISTRLGVGQPEEA